MTKSLVYSTSVRLSCCGAENPSVILCLTSPSLLAHPECPNSLESMPFDFTTMEASLSKVWKSSNTCGQNLGWTYSFTYDEDLLADPDTALKASDVVGVFCQGCFTDWIREQIGEEPYVVNNGDNTATFVSPHGCQYTFNAESGSSLEFDNSNTIDFITCGDFYKTIKAEVVEFIPPDDNVQDLGSTTNQFHDLFLAGTAYFEHWTISGSGIVFDTSVYIHGSSVNGADNQVLTLTADGSLGDSARGAFVNIGGNESTTPGSLNLQVGNVANAVVDVGYGGGATSHARLYANSTLQVQTTNGVALDFKNATNESTAAGAALLGANSPAVTLTAPYKWIKIFTSDGSTAYIPAWK